MYLFVSSSQSSHDVQRHVGRTRSVETAVTATAGKRVWSLTRVTAMAIRAAWATPVGVSALDLILVWRLPCSTLAASIVSCIVDT